MAAPELEVYISYIKKQFNRLISIVEKYAEGDFTKTVQIPKKQGIDPELTETIYRLASTIKNKMQDKNTILSKYKQNVKALQESEEMVKAFLNAPAEVMLWVDVQGVILRANDAAVERLGKPVSKLIGMNGWKLIPYELAESRRHYFKKVIRSGKPVRFEDKNRNTFFDNVFYPILDELGEVIQVAVLARDITEQKKVKEQYRDLVEKADIAILIDDKEGNFSYFNKKFAQLFGYSSQEIKNKSIRSLVHPEDVDWVMQYHTKRLQGKKVPSRYEFRGLRKDGSVIYLEVDAVKVKDEKGIGTRSYIWDITERKQAEEALRESEERYSAIVEDQIEMICRFKSDYILTFVNKAYARYWGKTVDELKGINFFTLIPEESRKNVKKHFDSFSPRNTVQIQEHKVINSNGKTGWQQWVNRSFFDDEGNIVEFQSVGRDITERKQMEEALQRNEQRLELAVTSAKIGLWDQDFKNNIITRSQEWAVMLGYDVKELDASINTFLDLIHPEDAPRVKEVIRKHETGKTKFFEIEHRMRTKQGNWKWILNIGKIVERDSQGHPLRATGVHIDINERKQAEEALRKSEEKYRLISENIPVVVYSALPDERSTNIFISGKAVELSGYSVEDFMEDPELWESVMYPEDREYVWEKIKEHRLKKTNLDVEYRIVTKEGTIKWIRDNAKPALNEHGNIIRIDGCMEDITKRKLAMEKAEEQRKELQNLSSHLMHTQEEERRKISQELHDELGQMLTALSINLTSMKKSMSKHCDAQSGERVKESMQLVNSMSDRLHEMILDLRPSMLDDLGLIPTLRWYIKRFQARTRINVSLDLSPPKQLLGKEIEVVLYRIIQEALTNTVKHAKADTIRICLKKSTASIKVTIEDDGQGFDTKKLSRIPVHKRGSGLPGMRERLLAVKGQLLITSKMGKGTRIEIIIPLGDKT